MLLARRLVLALLMLLLSQQPIVRALAACLVVLASLVLHFHNRPFASDRVNALELWLLAALAAAAVLSVRTATLLSLSVVDQAAWRNQVSAAALLVLTGALPAGACVCGGAMWLARCGGYLRRCGALRGAGHGARAKAEAQRGVAMRERLLP